MNGDVEEVSLYVHIPFCRRKCSYCHFYVILDNSEKQELLVTALLKEWRQNLSLLAGKRLASLYFGGGTPILLGGAKLSFLIEELTKGLSLAPGCEITVEANPEEITLPLVRELARGGVNRLSIGLQTHDDAILHTLGRLHSGTMALGAVETAAAGGIDNLSVDLMYDLPDQTLALWERTLAHTVALPIQHLSLYNLTIEPHTPFHRKRLELKPRLPDDTTSAAMFTTACRHLAAHGFEHYEISAFARNGHYSRHNLGYWTDRPFIGLGPSAFSYWQGRRYRNVPNFTRYCEAVEAEKSPCDFSEILDDEAHLRERLSVNLRLRKGVDLHRFPPLPSSIDDTLRKLAVEGLLHYEDSRVRLTERGFLFYDTVAIALI